MCVCLCVGTCLDVYVSVCGCELPFQLSVETSQTEISSAKLTVDRPDQQQQQHAVLHSAVPRHATPLRTAHCTLLAGVHISS